MKRTKILSFFMLIILTLDLLLGMFNIHINQFLDTNGDNRNIIIMANTLFGASRLNKAVVRISGEKLTSYQNIIKKLGEFMMYTDKQLSQKILYKYINKMNYAFKVEEYYIDHNQILDIQKNIHNVAENMKLKCIKNHNVKRYKVFLIPHKYSDAIYDELLTKGIQGPHRTSVVEVKHEISKYLDDIHNQYLNDRNSMLKNENIKRYTFGDLVNLNYMSQCLASYPEEYKYKINNHSYYILELLDKGSRIPIYGKNATYLMTIYPMSKALLQIERKHTSASTIYCLIANKFINQFNISNNFIQKHANKINEFEYLGIFTYIAGKFINYNLISNIIKSGTDIELNKLSHIMNCIEIDRFNQCNGKTYLIITQIGIILLLENESYSKEELNNIYMELSSMEEAKNYITDKEKIKSRTYYNIPFLENRNNLFKTYFGHTYNDMIKDKIIINDYYNSIILKITPIKNNIISKIQYPCYSLIHSIVLESNSK